MDKTEDGMRERLKRLRKAQTTINMERRRLSYRYGQLRESSEKIGTRWKIDSTLYGSMRVKSCPASCRYVNKFKANIFQCNMKDVAYASMETLGRHACSMCLFTNEEIETLLMMQRVKGNGSKSRG